MSDHDQIAEFLVAIGYANDDAGAKKVVETISGVESALEAADKAQERRRDGRGKAEEKANEKEVQDRRTAVKDLLENVNLTDQILDRREQRNSRRRKESEGAAEKAEAEAKKRQEDREKAEAVAAEKAKKAIEKAEAETKKKKEEKEKADAEAAEKQRKALDATRLAALGIAGAVVGAATSLFAATAQVAGGYDHLYYASQRTGASAQNIKSFQYAISQLGGTAEGALGALESFSEHLRKNPGLTSALRQMGVATETADGKPRDRVDVLQDAIKAFDKKYPGDKYYVQTQLQELFGIDEKTAQAIMRDTSKFQDEYTKVLKGFGLNTAEASERGKDFEQSMRSLWMTLDVLYEKVASDLAPTFGGFIRDLTAWIQGHHKEISGAILAIAEAVKETATAFKDVVVALKPAWEAFDGLSQSLLGQKGLTTAFELLGVVLALRVLKPLLAVAGLLRSLTAPAWVLSLLGISGTAVAAGLIAGGAAQVSGAIGKGGLPSGVDPITGTTPGDNIGGGLVKPGEEGALRRMWRNRPRILGGTGGQTDNAETPRGNGQGTRGGEKTSKMMAYAMDQLRREGVPEANVQAAASHLVGQATAESGLDPNKVHDQGTGFGIYGARLERRSRMFGWLEKHGYAKNSAEGQMRYMAHEAMTDPAYGTTREILKKANPGTFSQDVPRVTKNFENPKFVNERTGGVVGAFKAGPAADANADRPGEKPTDETEPAPAPLGRGRANFGKGPTKPRVEPRLDPTGSPDGAKPDGAKPDAASPSPSAGQGTSVKVSLALPPSLARMEVPKMDAPPISPSASQVSNVTNAPSTSITVTGASDPQATASEVQRQMDGVNGRFVRNMQSAFR